MSSDNGAVYFEITSEEDDELVGVSVDSSVAVEAQIHETSMMGDHGGDMEDSAGMEEDGEMELEPDMGAGGDVMQMVRSASPASSPSTSRNRNACTS